MNSPECQIEYAYSPDMANPVPAFRKNDVIGDRFVITDTLGVGGQARVYSAKDTAENGHNVALKIPYIGSETDFERVVREVEMTKLFSKKTDEAVPFVDAGVDTVAEHPFMYLATEQMKETLHDKLETAPLHRLGQEACAQMIAPALHVVATMHEKAILHRDIKPRNIFLDKEDHGHLGDFGLVGVESYTPLNDEELASAYEVLYYELTATGQPLGTIVNTAPEVVLNETGHRKAGDVFSAGVTLYKSLTGVHPSGKVPTANQYVQMMKTYEAPKMDAFAGIVSAELGQLAIACLDKHPENRPTMHEVVHVLETV